MVVSMSKKVTKIQEIEAHSSAVTCVVLGQLNGRVLATGGADCLVNLWVVGQKQPLKSLAGLSSAPECIKFDPSEESVVAGSASGSLKIWDLEADKIKRTLTGHKSSVTALDFLPLDPNFIVSGSADRSVKIWDLRRKACVISCKQHQDTVKEVLFSPHGKWITSAGIDGVIEVFQWQAGKILKELVHARSAVHSLAFHPEHLLLASAGHDGIVKFWDLETFELVSSTEKDASPIRCIKFQKDGSSLLAGCDDMLRNFGWEPGTCYDFIPVGWGRVGDMAVSGSYNQLIAASIGKTTVATYLVDLSRILGKDSVRVEEKEPDTTPAYRTLPRKLKDQRRQSTDPKPSARPPMRSHSREPVSRNYKTVAPKEATDPIIVFTPQRQLDRSPAREPSPSSESSSSPSPRRGAISSPSVIPRKIIKPIFQARMAKNGTEPNVQMIRPQPKEPVSKLERIGYLKSDDRAGGMHRSQSDQFQQFAPSKQMFKVNTNTNNVPTRKPFFNSAAQIHSPSFTTEDDDECTFSTTAASPYRTPVMPVFPVKSRYNWMADSPSSSPVTNTEDLFDSYEANNLTGATLTRIKVSHTPLLSMLNNRLDNLRSIQQMWGHGDTKAVIDAAVRFNDLSTLVDILNIICAKPTLWSLDCCSLVLPHLHKLVSHKFESYIMIAATTLKLLLKNFAPVIKGNLKALPSLGVDISREERVQKSRACYTHFLLLRDFIEKDNRNLSQNLRKECRQIKLLMQGLD